ncbi:MAG TPA: polyphosphate kinase 1 [Thermoplasmata archaeon]|nr:polyphosphate kinase 1 [Thermoplasmata archaeon]
MEAYRDLDDPSLYVNPNVARIRFMERVLEEAEDSIPPLLERTKFLAILGSNLDEMFMVRIAELRRLAHAGSTIAMADGLTPTQTLAEVRREILPLLARGSDCWRTSLLPGLMAGGVRILTHDELDRPEQRRLRAYFQDNIYPVLTPLAVDPGHPFPHISNLSVNLAVVLRDPKRGQQFARIKVPNVFPRFLPLPRGRRALPAAGTPAGVEPHEFIWIEEAIAANLDTLFPGLAVDTVYPFRVTRDASMDTKDAEAEDLLTVVEETVDRRAFGPAIRLEMTNAPPGNPVRELLTRHLGLEPEDVYETPGPLGKVDLWELTRLNRPDLKLPPIEPVTPPFLQAGEPVVDVLRRRDVLLYHPYESFSPVVDFIRQASRDPQVVAIKQTLYRIDRNSPIVAALLEARENGKQVAVLVELKARFDEEKNIAWARTLEKAGVHVTYGILGLKAHAKVCLVVRREGDRIARYVHVGTGNYNTETARMYADIGFLTSRPDFGADATELFNALTGYARKPRYRALLVAPGALRRAFLNRIEREIRRHRRRGDGYLAFKMNALEDKECIQALYRASRAGVRIDLQVRGFCCLRPGIPGVSDNITVISVVGRFLEHARIYYFHNGGNEEILLGSADMMPRNLDRRVEQLFPIEDPTIRTAIRDRILAVHLVDNVKARWMQPDGKYVRLHPAPGYPETDSQRWMADHAGVWNGYGNDQGLELASLEPIMHRRRTLPGEVERGDTPASRSARNLRRRGSSRGTRGADR